MKTLALALFMFHIPAIADTNALIEVKLFKGWVINGEIPFGNLAIKNIGTEPILLAKDPVDFEMGQLCFVKEMEIYDGLYQKISRYGGFFNLLPEETHVYEGRKFLLEVPHLFSETIRFTVSLYLGNGFWLDSAPLIVNGVVPDSEEQLAVITNNKLVRQGAKGVGSWKLVTVTYKDERWLYKKSILNPQGLIKEEFYFPVCPLSFANEIRVEPYDDEQLFKIWDGDKTMIFHLTKSIITEGPDENDVLGKWTRERKRKADADNAEVRRKKGLEK